MTIRNSSKINDKENKNNLNVNNLNFNFGND